MNRTDALELLGSAFSAERLRAARFLAGVRLTSAELATVRDRLSMEPDSWVQSALRRVLEPTGAPASQAGDENALDLRTVSELHAQATEQVTRLVLHEVRPILNSLTSWARLEMPDFDSSRTKGNIERLDQLLDTLVALNAASAAPLVVDFDLTNAIQSASLDLIDTGARVAFGRADAVPVTGDVRLISLAIVNCLRNALESAARSPRPELPVVISWGETDRDYWIAILDEGDGLPIGADHLLAPGITTKNDDGLHFGIGLTIAQRAMHSLEGDVDLRPREGFGAVAELRWPRRP